MWKVRPVVQTYSVMAYCVGHFRVVILQVQGIAPIDERKLEPNTMETIVRTELPRLQR